MIPGPILDKNGKQLGQHQGLAQYTIGQRKGIGIAAPQPLYVLEKQPANNSLIVGPVEDLHQKEIFARQVNWVSGEIPQKPVRAEVKIRDKADFHPATITPFGKNQVRILFDSPVRDASPGQFAVFYNEEYLLGGGQITLDQNEI